MHRHHNGELQIHVFLQNKVKFKLCTEIQLTCHFDLFFFFYYNVQSEMWLKYTDTPASDCTIGLLFLYL